MCLQEYVSAAGGVGGGPQCPTCQKPLTVDLTGATKSAAAKEVAAKLLGYKRTSILSRIDLDQFQTSTKIDALVSFMPGTHRFLVYYLLLYSSCARVFSF